MISASCSIEPDSLKLAKDGTLPSFFSVSRLSWARQIIGTLQVLAKALIDLETKETSCCLALRFELSPYVIKPR